MKNLLYILIFFPLFAFAQEIPISNTTVTTCTGTFVDTGGSAGNYGSGQNIFITICPDNPGDVTRLNFTDFDLEVNNDVMRIYQGQLPDIANPANLIGEFSGLNSPGNVLGDLLVGGGCLTIQFQSNPALTRPGWVADISCTPPCQSVNAVYDSSVPPLDPVENVILACPNEPVAFTGAGIFSDGNSAGATYEWTFGDGTTGFGQTTTHTYTNGGFFEVELTVIDAFGCESTNDIGLIVQVGTEPDFTGTAAADPIICVGDSTVLTGIVEAVPFQVNCTVPVADIINLEDISGMTFESCITVDCFGAGAVIENISDILEICATLEHSWVGDLVADIRAPDGTIVRLFDGNNTNPVSTYLGEPLDDPSMNPGVGYDYCFNSMGAVTLPNGPTVGPVGTPGGNSIAPGDYLPEGSLASLIGVPLNGDWCILMLDDQGSDDGYIFSWTINFDPGIIPPDAQFEPTILTEDWDPDPTIDAVIGDSIVVSPDVPGTYCYTYRVTDDFGCEHTEEVCIDVLPNPIANAPDDILICDDGIGTGVFDLTQNDALVLAAQDPLLFPNITYHNSQADADAGTPVIPNPGAYPITGISEIIFVRIEEPTGQCFDTAPFEIQFLPVTVLNPITDLLLCDDDADGFTLVNIPLLKNDEVLAGQNPAQYNVTYHLTPAEANADTGALPVPYNAPAPGQTIFVRVENITQNIGVCFAVNEFQLGIFEAPIATPPTILTICDEIPNDGIGTFNLTVKNAEITGGNPDAQVLYFESLVAAQVGTPLIAPANAYVNSTPGFQTLFVRVQNINNPACFNIVTLDIQVNNAPEIADPISPFFLCDNDEDFIETFDLTDKLDEIENGLVNVTTTFYDELNDAEDGINPILTPDAYVSANNEIFVVVENSAGCQTIGSFFLLLGEVPDYDAPLPFEQCDLESDGTEGFDLNEANAAIEGTIIGLSIRYFPTEITATDGNVIDQLPIPYQSSGGETVWVRIEDNETGCFGIEPMELILVPLPEIFEPDPLVFCDNDNDGFGEFILQEAEDQIRGGNPSGNLVVSFYETQPEAVQNTNPILDVPFENTTANLQIIYARLTDLDTGCFDTVALQLIVSEIPEISDPDPIIICDDDPDTVEEFDLTSAEAQILAGLTDNFVVQYFETQANADALFNPIVNTTQYPIQPSLVDPVTGAQTIFIVVTDLVSGCSAQTTLLLIVNLQPSLIAQPPLVLCDTPEFGAQIEAFDLTQIIAPITDGNTNILITFFTSQADADANVNAIQNTTAYLNVDPTDQTTAVNPQNVFIRAEDATTGCIETSFTIELRVENAPSPVEPTPLVVCDENNDGFALFDLTLKDAEIIGGDPNIVISYYTSVFDAENAQFPIDTTVLYENIVQFQQTVWVRVEFDTGVGLLPCFSIVPLDLIVEEGPSALLEPLEVIACDDDDDGIVSFDLTALIPQILNGQDPTLFTVSFHELLVDAEAGTPEIVDVTDYENTTNPQSIFYRIDTEDALNECFVTGEIILIVSAGPVIVDPQPFTVCDDLGEVNDGIVEFDLTLANAEITGGDAALNVQYFELEVDAQANENPIALPTAYENTSNPQNIFVRVIDGNTGCVAFTVLQLRVVPNPTPAIPEPLTQCDELPEDGDGLFDLTSVTQEVTGGEGWVLSFFETEADAIEDINPIDPALTTAYPNDGTPDVVFIRVTNPTTGCFEIVPLQLIVGALPDLSAVMTPLEECQVPFTNNGVFDLTDKDEEALGATQDPLDFIVSYYLTQPDAEAGINPIAPATAFNANLNNGPIIIWVGIENIATGCYNGGLQSFDLIFVEGATATMPLLPYTLCDAEGDNDGSTTFDLSTQDEEILNGQPTPQYVVTYYETLEGAEEGGAGNIGPSYVNSINPQTIYARVTNSLTGCHATTEVILNVEQLPFIELEETYRLCVDANGNPIEEDFGELSPPLLEIFLDNPEEYEIAWFLNDAVIEGQTGTSITAVQGGVYTVTITEIASGCEATTTTTVTVSSPPLVFSARLINGAFSGSNDIEVTVEGEGEYQFSLDGGFFQDSNILTGAEPGVVEITIQDVNGCGEVTFEFGVIDYLQFFTPNQDGFNDLWLVESIIEFDPTANIYIFDRYGKLLKQLSVLSNGWDGTFNGNQMPADDYWFLIEYTEDDVRKEFRSNFSLVR